ncbi:predicted protein [Streptomyces filamentosus NRRL 15998]|uniref:Predicted protein n=1 Tax=Streptomyces filamentosus NRRL 15998 TaxID=457431 RepID=D6AE40_STRFL|nr:predicted protein [Streptomyces filamentosus NRRL 15998]
MLGARWCQPLSVANTVRKHDQFPLDGGKFAPEAGRDRQVHRRCRSLLPRQHGHPHVREQFGDARPERRGTRAGGEELYAQVVVEQGQDIEQSRRRRDVVHDEQHATASHPRGPARRVVPDRHPYPPVLPLAHAAPLALPTPALATIYRQGHENGAVPCGRGPERTARSAGGYWPEPITG